MWSVQQQSMLNAMGYTVYVRPGIQSVVSENSLETSLHATTVIESALYKALLKAARGSDILPLNIDVDALRSSPQAKRALWPQLRRLMKS